MKKIVWILMLSMIVISCVRDETHFLDFYLGMPYEKCKEIQDKLEGEYKLSNAYDSKEYLFNTSKGSLDSYVFFSFEYEELRNIQIKIGKRSYPKQRKTGSVRALKSEVDEIFEMYKSKYGNPLKVTRTYDGFNGTWIWRKNNLEIEFFTGFNYYEEGYVSNPTIEYRFSEKYENERNEKILSGKKKKSQEEI